MKTTFKYTVLIAVLCLFFNPAKATHIVGGEIYYEDLGAGSGGNIYKIHMKVYRDCFNGIPPLDNPAFVTIFDANNVVMMTLNMPLLSSANVPPSINNPCIQTPNNVCVQEGIYEMTVTLAPKTGGYYIVYQRCCRNNTILNLIVPGSVGSTYWEHIPGPEVVSTNNSPRFNKFPPIFICNGIPIAFDHAATDPDGDQLVYSLCSPFNGLDACCPVVGSFPSSGQYCSNPPSNCPSVNTPPPYVSVPFSSGYNSAYPLSSSPAININSTSGFLNGTPNINGQWVVGVCVQEFRNGVLIGTHHRDFQFNVVSCIVNVVSVIQDQTQQCTGLTVNFNNLSIGSTFYHWDFGVNSAVDDTSNVVNPNYTYPDTGKYTVTLIADPGKPCSDTTKRTFYVYPFFAPTFTAPPGQCISGNSFSYSVAGQYAPYTKFNWQFGSNATPATGTMNPQSPVVYDAPGTYPVTVFVKQAICEATLQDSITIFGIPQASFSTAPSVVCDSGKVTMVNLSETDVPTNYFWQLSNGATSNEKNPVFVVSPPGVYSVTLTIMTLSGCVSTSTFTASGIIQVNPRPRAGFTFSPTETSIFEPDVFFYDQSVNATGWKYIFGTGGSDAFVPNPVYTYNWWGEFPVTQIVTNDFGCSDTARAIVKILPEFRFWIPNCFTPGNKDQLNDVFKPSVIGVEEYEFYIFDRWGEQIFKTSSTEEGWDGSYKGKSCKQDVYVWMIKFRNLVSKRREQHYGHVTLLR